MQSSGSYRLTVRQGPVPGKVFELAKDVMTIGRDVNNDLVINNSEVSRNHARLTSQSGGYLIEDLASTNGTFVNGQRLIGPKLLNSERRGRPGRDHRAGIQLRGRYERDRGGRRARTPDDEPSRPSRPPPRRGCLNPLPCPRPCRIRLR